jgi:hypothetical protein
LGGKFPSNFLNSKATDTRVEPSGKALAMQEKDAATIGGYCPCRKQVDWQCKRKGSLICE